MNNPVVTVTMDDSGVILIELYPGKAPNTVANFVSLIQEGFYNGLTFHRIVPGFMIQGGCPLGDGTGNPGYSIPGEFSANGFFRNDLTHERGVLSMARTERPNSAGSQFFIMVSGADYLDGEYAAFGKVTEGMGIVDGIVSGPRENDRATPPRRMVSVTVETFGEEYIVHKQ
ncbi:MAG: peptidylprolyl isomerase [Oscillospiraceae bacterium]|jgi:peptidyl-prolyl cis-trans isomerase B (cyclophilin B)|nr:peptidylprolyl isomerase [Oscillospiraceae bacterium]